jgi:hypothetical protein
VTTTRTDPIRVLRRLARQDTVGSEPQHAERREVCELCGAELEPRHGHVADLEARRLLCTCRACSLLFAERGAGGRYRGLPEQVRLVTDLDLTPATWEALQIPGEVAFLLRNESSGDVTACYPGPGGATESLLDLSAWREVLTANPVLDTVAPDVEAVLLRRRGGRFDCYLVPIDACYELVGIARRHWAGFSGGSEVWDQIATFFADLDAHSVPVDRHGEVHTDD